MHRFNIQQQRSEEEIIDSWNANTSPLVSIVCTTYNHGNYIEDALDGFLFQTTEFPFEIIVHDDASTDRTADLIRKYAQRYPTIIKPILQKENLKKLGVDKYKRYIYPKIRGSFVALCEGDDYWTKPNKLQLQVEGLQRNPEVDIAFHPAEELTAGICRPICWRASKETVLTADEVILGGGGFIPTASIVMRRHVLDLRTEFHERFPGAPVGDVITQAIGASRGGALFVPLSASVYRKGVPGSWTDRLRTDTSLLENWAFEVIQLQLNLDAFFDGRFSRTFRRKTRRVILGKLMRKDLSIEIREKIFCRYKYHLPGIERKILACTRFSSLLFSFIARCFRRFRSN